MAAFLYFVPDAAWIIPDAAALVAAGLDGVLGGAGLSAAPSAGPGGANGMLLAAGGEAPAYRPEGQTWALRQDGRAWLGFDPAAPPGPDELERPEQLPGHLVQLGDGRHWLCPVARLFGGESALPQTYLLEPGGVRKAVAPAWRDLWADCERLWAADQTLPELELLRIAHRALGVNFRLGTDEINALGLLHDRCLVGVLGALLDLPTVEAVRREAGGDPGAGSGASPGTPGGAAGGSGGPGPAEDTPPASPTSAG